MPRRAFSQLTKLIPPSKKNCLPHTFPLPSRDWPMAEPASRRRHNKDNDIGRINNHSAPVYFRIWADTPLANYPLIRFSHGPECRASGRQQAVGRDRLPVMPGLSGHLCAVRASVCNRWAPMAGQLRVRSSEFVDGSCGHSLTGAWQ